jgi:hypothetical protein
MDRTIRTDGRQSDGELSDLLQALFSIELMHPSAVVTLVSAWVSDVNVIDNRDGSFAGLNLPTRQIRLPEVLGRLAESGANVFVACNEDVHNQLFAEILKEEARRRGCLERVHVRVTANLHIKGLATDSFHLAGSMNFTHNGINVLGEEVTLRLDFDEVERAQIEYHGLYFAGME